jgi:hypothetical protein
MVTAYLGKKGGKNYPRIWLERLRKLQKTSVGITHPPYKISNIN